MTHYRPLRVVLVVLGLAAVVYGTSTLTGGWLGTPPWWALVRHAQLVDLDELERSGAIRLSHEFPPSREHPSWIEPRPGREWISGAVIAVGVGLGSWGACPRKGPPTVTRAWLPRSPARRPESVPQPALPKRPDFARHRTEPAFVHAPEGNGCIECSWSTLEDQLHWVRTFRTV